MDDEIDQQINVLKKQILTLYRELMWLYAQKEGKSEEHPSITYLRIILPYTHEGRNLRQGLDLMGKWALAYHDLILKYLLTGKMKRIKHDFLFLMLKGMPYHKYLRTQHWKAKREKAFRRADYRCQMCNKREGEVEEDGEGKVVLQVHHRASGDRGQEQLQDLTVLCKVCHLKHHQFQRLANPRK